MNVSIRVIENLHEGLDILDSEKSPQNGANRLMENGIFQRIHDFAGRLGAKQSRNDHIRAEVLLLSVHDASIEPDHVAGDDQLVLLRSVVVGRNKIGVLETDLRTENQT